MTKHHRRRCIPDAYLAYLVRIAVIKLTTLGQTAVNPHEYSPQHFALSIGSHNKSTLKPPPKNLSLLHMSSPRVIGLQLPTLHMGNGKVTAQKKPWTYAVCFIIF